MSIVNYFTEGMFQDSLESLQPKGTYRFALNAIDESDVASDFGLTNENAIEEIADFGGDIVGRSYIEERAQTLFFISNGGSELWLFDHKTAEKTFVCSDKEFGCDWGFGNCELIYGEFKKFNTCRELHVYWSSQCVYHVANIDELLNPARKAAIKELDDVCGHFDCFKAVCGPHISAIPSKFNGSALEAGSYACAIQLSDSDGNDTNIFEIGQFAVAESEDNTGGQIGKSSIKFNISNLDPRYNKAIIYVVKVVRGVTTVYKMDTHTYGDRGFTYTYYGQTGELVHSSVLAQRNKAFLRGQDQLQKDGFMLWYSLRNEQNLNYQKYANQIQVGYVEYEVSLEQAQKYHYTSLLRGEVYAFGIVWKYADGTYSRVFHIPGSPSGGSSSLETRATGEVEAFASSDSYKPILVSNLDTADQFDRKRNPSDIEDRRNESDKLESGVRTDASEIDQTRTDMVGAGECHDNLYGCDEAVTAMEADIDQITNTQQSNAELLAGMGLDKPDPDVKETTTLKQAALKLIDDAVGNREYVTRKRPVLNYTGVNQGAPGNPPTTPDPEVVLTDVSVQAVSTRGDNWVDGTGNNLTDEPPREVSTGSMEVYTSTVLYPKDKDCDGEFFYPQGPITHPRVPSTSSKPHFTSYTNGVENQYQPDNYPYAKTFVRLMAPKFSGIHQPTENELGKPLCPTSQYKIVYVKRTPQNKSIFAKGYLTGMFNGSSYGVNYAFPRHGVNSFETVDRSISNADNSRKGSHNNDAIYNFHSPDTDADQSFLPVSKIKSELALRGSGWRYGLYTEGQKPEDQWNGTRKDNFGARVANNLNHYTAGGGTADILGITFARANEPTTQASGITLPLNNRFRESSIYLQASSRMSGDSRDKSFVGDVLDHFAPTECNAPYVALVRELPDQYGSVEGLRYAELGLNATTATTTEIKGICGDTYIGPYSKKRTSYVSNKRGDFFNPPAKPLSPCRKRAWCDSPEDKIFEYLGLDFYPTKIPKSGDQWDPKNYAGLHTVSGSCGEFGKSKSAGEAGSATESESDFYGPRTLKSLVHTIVECEVNPFLRETGEGPQTITGRVHYTKLKDLHLDAAAPVGQPWERSWLGRFFSGVSQPSVKQISKKNALRSALGLILPAGMLTQLNNLDGIIGPVATFFTYPMMSALWIMATNTLFTNQKLNEMFRIGECKRDEEGGDLDESIEGFEDNYVVYNRDFTQVNDIFPHVAFNLPYNTCPCSECDKTNINNDYYYSNKQNPDSDIDAYRNTKINNYQNTPCHYGDLKRLFVMNNQLWAHYTDGLALIKLNPIQMSSDIVLQQSGDGQLLTEPQLMMEGVSEGFVGTEHPNAGIVTPAGYFFIDNRANKLYRFNGNPQEISAFGLFHFFKNHMGFCSAEDCYDEKTETGNHYALGWDPRHNRLFVTKYDGEYCGSFTASFRMIGDRIKFISFHSFVPQDYLWDRENLYSISGSKVYKHNVADKYLSVAGQQVPFVVETSAVAFADNRPTGDAFTTKSFQLDTQAEKAGEKDLDVTFNKIAIYNSAQGTGTRDVVFESDDADAQNSQRNRIIQLPELLLKKSRRTWTANNIADLTKAGCGGKPLTTLECPCVPISTINEDIFDCEVQKRQDYKKRFLRDDHIIYRLTYDLDTTTRLYLKRLITETE